MPRFTRLALSLLLLTTAPAALAADPLTTPGRAQRVCANRTLR